MGTFATVDGRAPIHFFASSKAWIEGDATRQLEQVAALKGIEAVAAMPDLHPGKFGPVGCAILADPIYPQLIGSDIGCGMGLYRLGIEARKLRLDRLAERLGKLDEPSGPAAFTAINKAGLTPSAFDAALGSIGGGNHFCEVQAIEEIADADVAAANGLVRGQAFALVHSGSRGLGYSILDQVLKSQTTSALDRDSDAGRAYIAAHDHAITWAKLNRQLIAERAAAAVQADLTMIADLAHNMVEIVRTSGSPRSLHRKGAAAANRGLVPIPGSRGTLSYLVEPLPDSPREALASLAHGAGRKYDRASMHGRVRTKKSDLTELKRNPFGGIVVCEDRDLLVEEAPTAYKSIERVIEDLVAFKLVRVVATFRPLVTFKKGVAHKSDRKRDKSGRKERR